MDRMRSLLLLLAVLLLPLAEPAIAAPVVGVVSIHAIQGRGARSPLAGRQVVTEGAVTLVTGRGFFLQERTDAGDERASRGLFVFTGAAPGVVAGQCVRLGGQVVEFPVGAAGPRSARRRTLTELHPVGDVRVLREGCEVAPVDLAWPLAEGDDLRRVEGMVVTLRGPWTVQQNFFLEHRGQVTLATGGRVLAPTNVLRPGPAAQAMARANARRSLVLDAGAAPLAPGALLGADGTLRAGDTLAEVTGVVDLGRVPGRQPALATWRIHPLRPPHFARANPRTAAPAPVGGDIRIAAVNVDNFFLTPADGHRVCGPRRRTADCRGAHDAAGVERQRAKIVAMLAAVDADVVALMEIENDGGAALRSLVGALNERVGAPAWLPVDEPAGASGGDAIRIGLIYKPARVWPLGVARGDRDPVHSRPPLAQAFVSTQGARRFILVASHFKSRRCEGATGAERDRGDLQGCWSPRRVAQARALARFAGAVARASGIADTLLVGDFNAYAHEDPPTRLVASGFADQAARFEPAGYSYVYDGAAGRLDGVFASVSLAERVTGVVTWHVDADEPAWLDDVAASPALDARASAGASQGASVSAPVGPAPAPGVGTGTRTVAVAGAGAATPWRASDHDPVVIGLRLDDP